MTTKADLVKSVLGVLRQQLGLGETPPGSNHNFIVEWYNAEIDLIGNGPWCEMTVSWAFARAGLLDLKKPRAYTVYACEDAAKGVNGSSWHYGTSGIAAGDAVYFDWSRSKNDYGKVDHVGVIEKVNGNGTYYVLEGNRNDELQRVLRDDTYIVGYVRFDWERATTVNPTPIPKPEPKPSTANPILVKLIQDALEVDRDGEWGPITDARLKTMRAAARAHVGWPQLVPAKFEIGRVQKVTDTTPDGVWGPKSQAALVAWVKDFQKLLGVTPDGEWGPDTDNAYLTARKKHYTA